MVIRNIINCSNPNNCIVVSITNICCQTNKTNKTMNTTAFTANDIKRLLIYCRYRFGTTNVPVIECLAALEADAAELNVSRLRYLEIIYELHIVMSLF